MSVGLVKVYWRQIPIDIDPVVSYNSHSSGNYFSSYVENFVVVVGDFLFQAAKVAFPIWVQCRIDHE